MKKQTIYQYCIGFFGALIVLALCYLVSYNMAMKNFHKQFEKYYGTQFGEKIIQEEPKEVAEKMQTEVVEPEKSLPVDAANSGKITSKTKYVLEIYDIMEDRMSEYELSTPAYLVGLNREELLSYIKDYMSDLPLDEFQMGLVSYDIVSFSENKIVLRKSYDKSTVPYQYYLVIERGVLVVYYADKKTVYEYTGIEASTLPEEEQVRLAYGVFIKDQEELYGLLQGYSS